MECPECKKEIGDIPISNTFFKCPYCGKQVMEGI